MICNNCSAEIADTSKFCGVCGTPVTPASCEPFEEIGIEKEKECLDSFARFFKYERRAWKILGIVMLCFSCFFATFGFLSAVIGVATNEVLAGFGVIYILYALLFIPIAIVNLKMIGRAEHYMNIVYSDADAVEERAGSVGMIILAAFFNEIALIFIIINFVRAKTQKNILKSAQRRQEAFRNNNQ